MKKKLFSRREKVLAAAVTTALVVAPVALSVERPTPAKAEESMPPYTNVDKIYDMVLPANATSGLIDLNVLFGSGAWYFYHSSDSDHMLASVDEDLLAGGLLKITTHAPETVPATVTFSLSVLPEDSEDMQMEQFKVTIGLPTGADGRFDIGDAVSFMKSNPDDYGPTTATPAIVSGLLGGIGPKPENMYQMPGNRQPVAAPGGIEGQSLISGNDVDFTELLGNLSGYFSDPDGQPLTYYFGSSNTSVVSTYLSEMGEWRASALCPGDSTITFVAMDEAGGAAYTTFNVHVDSEGGSGNQSPYYYSTIATNYLLQGASIDLSDYFTDPDEDDLTYAIDVLDSGGTTNTVNLEGSTLSFTDIPLYAEITGIHATDEDGASTEMDVSIERGYPNALDTQSLYLDSSFSLDLSTVFGGNPSMSYSVDTHDSVSASVEDSVYLKIDADGLGDSLIHVYAYDSDTEKTYQDDLSVHVLPFSDTGGKVHVPTLFPNDDAFDLYLNHMTKSPDASTMLGTGDYIDVGGPSGTTLTFTFDPNNDGKKVIKVPYIKP